MLQCCNARFPVNAEPCPHHVHTHPQRRGLLRRLVALGLLTWTPGKRLYCMPSAVREAAVTLSHSLGETGGEQ